MLEEIIYLWSEEADKISKLKDFHLPCFYGQSLKSMEIGNIADSGQKVSYLPISFTLRLSCVGLLGSHEEKA